MRPAFVGQRLAFHVHLEGARLWCDLAARCWDLPDPARAWFATLLDTGGGRLPAEVPGDLSGILHELAEAGGIVPEAEQEGAAFRCHRVDIETVRQCNARCAYCPQHRAPKPRAVMARRVFEQVLRLLAPTPPSWVALNHYGEPLLDPAFAERVSLLAGHGLALHLFTNGSLWSPRHERLLETVRVFQVVVNYPSGDPARWSELMGLPARLHGRTTRSLLALASRYSEDGRFTVLVNGITPDLQARAEGVGALLHHIPGARVLAWRSHSRAGTITTPMVECAPSLRQERPGGCERIVGQLHVAWDGRVFLCCNDYHQQVGFGNVQDVSSLDELMLSEAAIATRRAIYGLDPMPPSMICRHCVRLRAGRVTDAGRDQA